MIVQEAEDPRAIVRRVLEEQLLTSPTLKISVDGPLIVRVALREGLELDPAAACQALGEEAPSFGFKAAGDDSRGRRQWQRENPRYCFCKKHHVRGVAVSLIEGGSISFRCVHKYHGSTESCRLGHVRISLLVKFLPKLPPDLLSQCIGIRPTVEGPGLKNGARE